MSELQAAAETNPGPSTAAQPLSSTQGLLQSLAFWSCLLLAAGAYALATLAPSSLRNQQLAAQRAAADAQLAHLLTQIDRYERYCRQLTAAAATAPAQVAASGTTGRDGEAGVGAVPIVPRQQMPLDESLQFHLDAVDAREQPPLQPAAAPVVVLLSRSALLRNAVRGGSALLLLLAFTLCLDPPADLAPPPPRRSRSSWKTWRPLQRLRMRYRSGESATRA